ncbi:unnamed protein product [Clavelina lepadiformis]|uniref:Uncharacterized protein n=1 Tax=Clavelina lepadiformis TaxID=159417 RepID=A0ABP0G6T8_CLALP
MDVLSILGKAYIEESSRRDWQRNSFFPKTLHQMRQKFSDISKKCTSWAAQSKLQRAEEDDQSPVALQLDTHSSSHLIFGVSANCNNRVLLVQITARRPGITASMQLSTDTTKAFSK